MAEAWGDKIYTSSGNYWQAGVNAYITSWADDRVTVHVDAKVYTRWSFNVYANGSAGGTNDSTRYWNGSLNQGVGVTTNFISYDTWYSRNYGSDRYVTLWSSYTVTGGYGNGWSGAKVTLTIPSRPYKNPLPPKNLSVSRVSDTKASLTWEANYTNDRGAYPWHTIVISRSTDGGSYSDIATLDWSATNYNDTSTRAGHYYKYRVSPRNTTGSATAQTGTVYMTPTPPESVTASAASATTASVFAEGAPSYIDGYEAQHRVGSSGTWGDTTKSKTSPITMASDAGDNWYRVRVYKGSLYSAYKTTSKALTTISQPLAPSVSMPSIAASGSSVKVTWTPNHPDNSELKGSQIEVTKPDGTTSTATTSDNSTSTTISSLAVGTYKVRVRTKGLWAASNSGWGAWSSYARMTVYDRPTVSITSPGSTVTAMPITVTWTASDSTGITRQEVKIAKPSGATAVSKTAPIGTSTISITADEFTPQNGSSYNVTVTITGGSSLTKSVTKTFKVSWAQPNAPSATVSYDKFLFAHVIVNTNDTSSSVTTKSVSVERVDSDGNSTLIDSGLTDGQEAIDFLAPLNTEYSYRVVAHAASGTSSSVIVPAYVDSFGDEAFNFGANAAYCLRLGYNTNASNQLQHTGESFHFALGTDAPNLPTFYPDGDSSFGGSRSYVVWGDESYKRVNSIIRDPASAVCWFRDYYGGVARAYVQFTLGYDAGAYNQYTVSADITETVWEEPERG